MKKVTSGNKDSATAYVCIKNAENLRHYAETKQTRPQICWKYKIIVWLKQNNIGLAPRKYMRKKNPLTFCQGILKMI
jgi:hypothetical protein